MANSKISALTSAATVAGTEVLPIVQSSATVKVSVANLTPGLDTITAAKGGTGQTSYAVGDLLYANTTTTLAKLPDVATGNALISGGVGVAPAWGKIGLTTHVSGTLGVANGGTGTTTAFTAGSVVFAGASGVYSQDNANLFFDDTNNRLGVATNTPASVFEVKATVTGTTPNAVKLYTSYIHNSSVGANANELAGWAVRYGDTSSTPIWFGAKFLKNGINAASDFSVWTSSDGDISNLVERLKVGASGIATMSVYGAGAATFSAAGVISSVSDETWKIKDGVPVDPDSMVKKLEPGYWYYNDEKKEVFGTDRQLGFYAQNVHAAIGKEAAPTPETFTVKDDDGNEITKNKPWGYYDRSVLAVVVMSLQKALTTIESLTTRIETLEEKVKQYQP